MRFRRPSPLEDEEDTQSTSSFDEVEVRFSSEPVAFDPEPEELEVDILVLVSNKVAEATPRL